MSTSKKATISSTDLCPRKQNRIDGGSSSNQYLKRIKYGKQAPGPQDDCHFLAVFDYGEHDHANPGPDDATKWPVRADPFSTFRSGFEIRSYRWCQRVLMFHNFAELGQKPDRSGVYLSVIADEIGKFFWRFR